MVTAEECPRIRKAFLEQERRAMPAAQRDDIIEELRDDLNARRRGTRVGSRPASSRR
jgi:hypothetical protein